MFNRNIIFNIGQSTLGDIFARVPILFAQLAIAKFFGPFLFGLFSYVQLITGYGMLFEFGLLSAYSRNEPVALGVGKLAYAENMRSVTFTGLLLISSAVFFIFLIASILPYLNSSLSRIDVLLMGALIFIQQIYGYFQSQYQNHKLFLHLSYGKCLYGISYFVLVFIFLRYKNISLVLLSWVLSYALSVILYAVMRPSLRPRFLLRKDLLKSQIKAGLPIYFGMMGKFFLSSIHRVFIGCFLGAVSLGYYSCSTVYITIILILYTLVSNVIYPHLLNKVEISSKKDLVDIFSVLMCDISKLLDPLICIVPMLFYLIIRLYMPKYMPGLWPGLLLIFSAYLLGKSNMLCVILPAISKSKEMFMCTVISLALMLISLLFVWYFFHPGILMYSIIVTINWIIFDCILFFVLYYEYDGAIKSLWEVIFAPVSAVFAFISLAVFTMNKLSNLQAIIVFLIFSLLLLIFTLYNFFQVYLKVPKNRISLLNLSN